MSEKLKYKVGDEVLLKATVKELSESSCTLDFGLLGKAIQYQATIAQMDINKKVKIPLFVADIIVRAKEQNKTLYEVLSTYGVEYSIDDFDSFDDIIRHNVFVECWLEDNSDTFARAWLDGYEVDKEKRYMVIPKHTNQILVKQGDSFIFTLPNPFDEEDGKHLFTKQELIDAGFGDVFDNEMFEVEDVE